MTLKERHEGGAIAAVSVMLSKVDCVLSSYVTAMIA